jgi:hypothetical protein
MSDELSICMREKIICPAYVPSLDKNKAVILFVEKYSNTGINAPTLMKLIPIAEKPKYRNGYYLRNNIFQTVMLTVIAQ